MQRLSRPVFIGVILWVVLIYALYFLLRPPMLPAIPDWNLEFSIADSVLALLNRLLDVASVLLILGVAGGTGRWLAVTLCPDWVMALSRPERIGGDALLGLGVLSVLIFLVGLIWLHVISVVILLLGLILGVQGALLAWLIDIRDWWRAWQLESIWDRLLVGFIVVVLFMAFIMALTPPTAFDSLVYHLVGPEQYVLDNQFTALPDNHFFGFPQQTQTLYATQMALCTDFFSEDIEVRLTGTVLIHWLFGVLSLLVVGGYGARRFNLRIGLLAVVILLTGPSFWRELSWAYNDLPPVGYGMLAFIALEFWQRGEYIPELYEEIERPPGKVEFVDYREYNPALRSNSQAWLMLAAVFVGLAMSIKYTLLSIGVAGGLYVLIYSDQRRFLYVMRQAVLYVGVATLVLAPWLLRNFAFYDNPVYPFGFYTTDWDALKAEWYTNTPDALFNLRPLEWALIPIASLVLGLEGSHYQTEITPLFLILIPLLLLTWRQLNPEWKRSLERMAVLAGGVYLFWLFASTQSVYGIQTRLYYVMFPLLALAAAVAFDSLRNIEQVGRIVQITMAIFIIITLSNYFWGRQGMLRERHFMQSHAIPNVLGLTDDKTYRVENQPVSTWVYDRLNALPEGTKIVFFWETRSLYCDESWIDCQQDTVLYRWWHDRRTIGDGSAEEILNHYREQGVDYVLVLNIWRLQQFDTIHFFTEADRREWQRMEDLLHLEWERGSWEPVLDDDPWEGEPIYQFYRIPDVAVFGG